MTHTHQVNEITDGKFDSPWTLSQGEKCRFCGKATVYYRGWESSCGGYEDVKIECRTCGRAWWEEGADA